MKDFEKTKAITESGKAYLYLAPAILLAGLFCWYPALKGLVQSFLTINQANNVQGFAGLGNYRILFSDRLFWHSVLVTAKFVAVFVPVNTFVTLLAASMTRRRSRFSFIAEYVFFTLVAVSLSAYTLVIREIFRGQASIANRLLGTSFAWINDKAGAMATMVILGVFLDFGLDYILLMCAFRSNDKGVIEAARMDGAGGWRLFFQIELPMIRETVLVTVFLALKDALLIVAPIMILTEGGPTGSTSTIMFYYYIEAFKSSNRAVQNALSTLVLTMAGIAMALYTSRRSSNL